MATKAPHIAPSAPALPGQARPICGAGWRAHAQGPDGILIAAGNRRDILGAYRLLNKFEAA